MTSGQRALRSIMRRLAVEGHPYWREHWPPQRHASYSHRSHLLDYRQMTSRAVAMGEGVVSVSDPFTDALDALRTHVPPPSYQVIVNTRQMADVAAWWEWDNLPVSEQMHRRYGRSWVRWPNHTAAYCHRLLRTA